MKVFFSLKTCMLFSLVFLSSYAEGTTTNIWTQSLDSEFNKGTTQNVSTNTAGEIQLSQKTESVPGIEGAFVWSMSVDDQNRVFVGTGDPGIVYLIKDGSEAVELFRSPELYIQSLVTDKSGNLYAGTAPHGVIYKIDNKGKTTIFCCLPVPYIWDMAVDSNSNLFAATGNNGILFKVSPDGTPEVFFDSPETNLLNILLDQHDNIYIGTEPDGLVYKVSSSGQAQVLYDADEGEIHCLAIDPSNNIYAGTASGVQTQMPASSIPQFPIQTGAVTSIFREGSAWDLNIPDELPVTQPVYVQRQRSILKDVGRASSKVIGVPTIPNYVYKITQEGFVQRIFETGHAFILGISLDVQNNLCVVTGNSPGVYKVYGEEISSSLMNVEEVQVLCCVNTSRNELYVGTGNTGKVYKILPSFINEGTFISNVLDTTTVSDWGTIYWAGKQPEGTKISLATRSGNSERADSTWSQWSEPYVLSGERITSPPARFIQYKATLQTAHTGITPILNTVSVSYLPKNQPPKIISFSVEKDTSSRVQKSQDSKAGDKVELKPQTSLNQKSHHQMAQKSIQWEVEDPNDDTLQLTISYKGVDEKAWKVIDKNTQKKGNYTWDTLRLPDGKYQIRLEANDSPDNPPETAFNMEDITQPTVVDNSRPVIQSLNSVKREDGRYTISGTVRDDYSSILKVQYTIDGQEWISAYPVDGLFDSTEESFQITTKPFPSGDYTLIINAFDSEGNIGAEKVLLEVK